MTRQVGLFLVFLAVVVVAFLIAPALCRSPYQRQPYHACRNNLRQIELAKAMYALDHNLMTNDSFISGVVVTPAQLTTNYIRHGWSAFRCPCGGVYSPNRLSQKPTCSYSIKDKKHALPVD